MQVLEKTENTKTIKQLAQLSKKLPGKKNPIVDGWIKRIRGIDPYEMTEGQLNNLKGIIKEVNIASELVDYGGSIKPLGEKGSHGEFAWEYNGIAYRVEVKATQNALLSSGKGSYKKYLQIFAERAQQKNQVPLLIVKERITNTKVLQICKELGIKVIDTSRSLERVVGK